MFLFHNNSVDWMIVGLGNPGRDYERSRHNTGWMVMDRLEAQLGVRVDKDRFRAQTATADYRGQKLLLLKPQTFMNSSGIAVEAAAHFYKIPPERVLVIFDDISLPVGKIRVRPSGSAGGHNGLKSIIAMLHSDAFPRVKVGVGAKPHPDYDLADWVLSAVGKDEQPAYQSAIENAADAALCILESGCDKAAGTFNGK